MPGTGNGRLPPQVVAVALAGAASTRSTDAVAWERLGAALKEAERHFDLIVIDTAPILVVPDAIPLLSRSAESSSSGACAGRGVPHLPSNGAARHRGRADAGRGDQLRRQGRRLRVRLRGPPLRPAGRLALVHVLVTGGAGFIGSNLVDGLLAAGHAVRVLDNFSTGHRHNLAADDVELIEGDLRSYERVHNAVRGCEVVFHQGALPSVPRSVQDPITTSEVNVGGTLNVLLNARDEGVRRVVFASSSSIYGDAPGFPRTESQPLSPLAPYAVSKLAAEHYCRVFATVYELETVSLRYFNVFGRHQDPDSMYSAVIPRFITSMLVGQSPVIYGSGGQSRDFTHVDDVVAANLLAMDAPLASGGTFNVACGKHHSLRTLVEVLNRILEADIQPIHAAARPGDVERSWADIERAREVLGYVPKIDFEQGLRRALDAYAADTRGSPAEAVSG